MGYSPKARAALMSAVIFLLLSSCSAYFAFVRLRASQHWVQHTREVQHALDRFSVLATRVGRLRAEYVDSGDPDLLQRQVAAVVDMRNGLAQIQRLTADNVTQQTSFAQLAQITEHRIALMDQAADLKRSGKSSLEAQAPIARQIVTSANATEQVLQSMDEEEQRLLKERQSREATSFKVTAGVLIASLFMALLLFLIHHQLLTEQVKERQRAENAQRALSARLLTLQDEERRKFARELHDSVGQHLAAIKMAIASLDRHLPGDPTLQDCLKLLDDSISETRTISYLLHPPLLDDAGLKSAFRWFVEGFGQRSGIQVQLQIFDEGERFDDATELVLFRALQESLTNVHRHSGAKQADVSLSVVGKEIVLKVKDYGRGMPSAVLQNLKDSGSRGVGLAGMLERVREIGGNLEIRSDSGGTEVTVRVPVRKRQLRPVIPNTEKQEVIG